MLPSIEELRKMRKSLGISQKELARISGVSQSYIARLEKGEINPAYDKVRKIFEYLNTSGNRARDIDIKAEFIMTKDVDTCEMNDSIISALNKMREKGYSQLPVVTSDKRIIGTITESDINDMLIKGTSIESLKLLTVKKVMGKVLPQLDKNSPISMIYPLLKYSNAVLIVDGAELKGIITKADVLKAVETYG
ncbi:CBS domain-containing protein [Ferroplasma sp.]|uniref:XRE family transcriptional regulator n=1 Tax=Ferroplasma sp. TaxID=2591003 RepID=UPI002637B0F7|nr:CBS domain-containing protein [Ferroplasma sp.]MCL4452762.1 CBS domain-containing protein [Candidatus Thermoplasmatota archaeon]WMT51614.1 MAG: CBS domain-containing protein [Ferroplasma sp.]